MFHGRAWKVSPRRGTPARAGSGIALRIDDPSCREDRLLPFLSVCVSRGRRGCQEKSARTANPPTGCDRPVRPMMRALRRGRGPPHLGSETGSNTSFPQRLAGSATLSPPSSAGSAGARALRYPAVGHPSWGAIACATSAATRTRETNLRITAATIVQADPVRAANLRAGGGTCYARVGETPMSRVAASPRGPPVPRRLDSAWCIRQVSGHVRGPCRGGLVPATACTRRCRVAPVIRPYREASSTGCVAATARYRQCAVRRPQ